MHVALPTLSVERSSAFEEQEFHIPPHVGGKLAEMVIGGLYESRTRFLAELVANAYDELRLAGPNAGWAPRIHLPTPLEPWFEVIAICHEASRKPAIPARKPASV